MSGILGGIKANGTTGQRGTKASGANLSRLASKDGNFSVSDGVHKHYTAHNGTFPAFAHYSARGHALFTFSCVAQVIRVQGSTTIQGQVFAL